MHTTGHIRGRVCSYLRKRGITGAFHRPLPICSSSLSRSTSSPPSSRNFTNTTTCLQGKDPSNRVADFIANRKEEELPLGGKAFVECDREAVIDLFQKHAVNCDVSGRYLDREGLTQVLRAVGENTDPKTVENLFKFTDMKQKGVIELDVRHYSSEVVVQTLQAQPYPWLSLCLSLCLSLSLNTHEICFSFRNFCNKPMSF